MKGGRGDSAVILAFPIVVPTFFGPSSFSGISSLPVFPIFRSFQLFAYCSGQCWGSGSVCFLFLASSIQIRHYYLYESGSFRHQTKKVGKTLFTRYRYCFVTCIRLFITED